MIAVAGIGIVSAIGIGKEDTLRSLREGRSGIGEMRYLPTKHRELPCGEVKKSNADLKAMLGISGMQDYGRTALLGAVAVREAIKDWGVKEGVKIRLALVSGTTVGGMDSGDWSCGNCTDEIARLAGLPENTETCTISTACSSALNAIIVGCEMLNNDEADIVIAGGAEALSVFHLNGFNSLKILDKERCRPFAEDRAGLNLGEGAAFVVLKKGVEGGVKIAGYGNRCDAFHQTATSENGEGAYLAMMEALRSAGMSPKDIDYVNAHGTGTPDNDKSETIALKRVFGGAMPPCTSTKNLTGHATSAAGSIELVISILMMQDRGYDTVMCNSFGFGGNDSSVVLERGVERGVEKGLKKGVEKGLKVACQCTVDSDEQLKELREFMSPMQTRRMSRLMKAAMLSSLKALKEAGMDTPDAIIAATRYGMYEESMQIRKELEESGEETVSPTLFMQSTHNTIASAIAIRTKCHGYNITYTQNEQSMDWAMRDAERLIRAGQGKNVLVIECDAKEKLHSRAIVMSLCDC